MSSNLEYEVGINENGIKIKEYMKDILKLSGRFIKSASIEKRIKVNGKNIKLDYKLKSGDKIEIIVQKQESQNIMPEDLGIEVVYEDDDLIIVNKPPFMLVHPTQNYPTGTLSNGVMYHFQKNNDKSIVRLVSRLDRDTSGFVMIAKNSFSHMNLAKASDENKVVKSYLAVVHGQINPAEGAIDLPIGDSEDSVRRTIRDDGQKSITHYKSIKNYEEGALIELVLETGRTHQIRVHLSHIGNPIYGDSLYGKEENEFINRQALHAYKLVFPHPRTGEIITLETELPKDIKDLIEKIK